MPERAYTERQTRGDRWRSAMTVALTSRGPHRSAVQASADAGIALADAESRGDRLKLRDLRTLLDRQRDDGTGMMRRHRRGTTGYAVGYELRERALAGLRILERE